MTAPTASFAALGDPVRATIVERLSIADATVGELAALFAITFQAVSQHVGVLERAGLVSRHREGRTRRVRLETAPLDDALAWMGSRRAAIDARYERLDALLADLQRPTDPEPRITAPHHPPKETP